MVEWVRNKQLVGERGLERRSNQLDHLLPVVEFASTAIRGGHRHIGQLDDHGADFIPRGTMLRGLQHSARHQTLALAAQRTRRELSARALDAHAAKARLSRAHRDRRVRRAASGRAQSRRLQVHPSPSRLELEPAAAPPRLLLSPHQLRQSVAAERRGRCRRGQSRQTLRHSRSTHRRETKVLGL